jgi:hypothetical protein
MNEEHTGIPGIDRVIETILEELKKAELKDYKNERIRF